MSEEEISEDSDDSYGKHMENSFVKQTPQLYLKYVLTTKAWYYYRLQRSCGKVMFLHLSVILFTGGVSVEGVSV